MGFTAFLCELWLGDNHILTVLMVAGSILMTLLVYGPLQYWNRRGIWIIVATACGWAAALGGFVVWIHLLVSHQTSEAYAVRIGFPMITALIGLLVIRLTRLNAIAYLSTILSAAIVGMAVSLFENTTYSLSDWTGLQLAMLLGRAGIFSLWFAAMSIP